MSIFDQYHKAAVASVCCAACFVVGFIMIFWIEPGINLNPHQRLAFILSHGRFFQLWYFIIFIVFASCLMVLCRAINHWLGAHTTVATQLVAVCGFIWSAYCFSIGLIALFTIEYLLQLPSEEQTEVWFVIFAIQMGLGDGIEWVGGIWLTALSWVMLQRKICPKAIHIFGFIIGVIGCLTLHPSLEVAGAIFGLSQIVWFVWMGLILRAKYNLRRN